MLSQQITQIAGLIAALTDPFKALEEMVARHEQQLQDMIDPTPPPPPPPGDILFNFCVNQGDCDGSEQPLGTFCNQNAPRVVPSGDYGVPSREGTHMMETWLHRLKSKYTYRTMAIIKEDDRAAASQTPGSDRVLHLDHNKDYWLALSMFVPADWVFDPLTTILFQCKCRPDPGEVNRQPAFCINTRDDQWETVIRWDTRATTPSSEGTHYPDSVRPWSGPLTPDLGQWTNWLFHFRWHWVDGLTQVWKNGQQVIDYEGGNCANDKEGIYLSFGPYEWSWREKWWSKLSYNTEWRRLWFDSFRIGRKRTDVAIPA